MQCFICNSKVVIIYSLDLINNNPTTLKQLMTLTNINSRKTYNNSDDQHVYISFALVRPSRLGEPGAVGLACVTRLKKTSVLHLVRAVTILHLLTGLDTEDLISLFWPTRIQNSRPMTSRPPLFVVKTRQ